MEITNSAFPKVPPQAIANTGEEGAILEVAEKFFEDVLAYLGYSGNALVFTNVQDAALTDPISKSAWYGDVRMLFVRGERLVASIVHTRTTFNMACISCALYFSEENAETFQWRDPT